MSRPSAFGKAHVAPRFARWLSETLSNREIEPDDLARELTKKEVDKEDREHHPRSLVRAWMNGSSVVTPRRAYDTGQALNSLGLDWCCGPLTLLAAGYVPDFIATLNALSKDPLGARLAVELFVHVPWAVTAITDDERIANKSASRYSKTARGRLATLVSEKPIVNADARRLLPADRGNRIRVAFGVARQTRPRFSATGNKLRETLELAEKVAGRLGNPDAQLLVALPLLYAWAECIDPSAGNPGVTGRRHLEWLIRSRLGDVTGYSDRGTLHIDLDEKRVSRAIATMEA